MCIFLQHVYKEGIKDVSVNSCTTILYIEVKGENSQEKRERKRKDKKREKKEKKS